MPALDQLFTTVEEYDNMTIQYLTVSKSCFTMFLLCAGIPSLGGAGPARSTRHKKQLVTRVFAFFT